MSEFAKLYATNRGQVLVVIDLTGDEDSPCIICSTMPEGFGVCSTKINFTDTDEGCKEAEKVFENMSEAVALKALEPLFQIADEARAASEQEAVDASC